VPEAVEAVRHGSSDPWSLQWMALALTPGLGPTKARRLVERFGGVQAVFNATLTELEAAGIQAVAAQSLGTGRSLELAQDELAALRRPIFTSLRWKTQPIRRRSNRFTIRR
jgi:predicted Rossmann fold nucleotide-binding protein DprA/Smf involved in DNA uptake